MENNNNNISNTEERGAEVLPTDVSSSPDRINAREWTSFINNKQKLATQNYVDMDDIVVPIIIKKSDDGKEYIALQYTYNAISNQIFLESPKIAMKYKKEAYSDREVAIRVNDLMDQLKLAPIDNTQKDLSSNFDPVSASFTNQMAKFVELDVKNDNETEEYKGDDRIKWFPVSSLKSLLSKDCPMSVATRYGLELYYQKHRDEIDKIFQTSANINKELLTNPKGYLEEKYYKQLNKYNKKSIIFKAFDRLKSLAESVIEKFRKRGKEKNPYKEEQARQGHVHSELYKGRRFDIKEAEIPGHIQELRALGEIEYESGDLKPNTNKKTSKKYDTMETYIGGTSIDSIQNVVARIKDGKIQVRLQKNLRSPFIERLGMENAHFYEIVGGGIEESDKENATSQEEIHKNAVRRETLQEAGFELDDGSVKIDILKLSGPNLYSQGTDEFTTFYVSILPEDYDKELHQQLENEEMIDEGDWYDLDTLNIDKLHSPIAKKLGLLISRREVQNYLEQKRLEKLGKEKSSIPSRESGERV